LGTPSGTLRGEAALGELVEDHLNRSLVLWVYNSEFDVVREVEIVPRRDWGGEGALGAVLGYGALHRLPIGLGEEVEGPGEVVFETKEDDIRAGPNTPFPTEKVEGQFLVPANMFSPPPLASPSGNQQSSGRQGRKPRHPHGAVASFDEYFRESEKQSKEQDFGPSSGISPVAPPPKLNAQAPSSSSVSPPVNIDEATG
jgi:hypothetical protein